MFLPIFVGFPAEFSIRDNATLSVKALNASGPGASMGAVTGAVATVRKAGDLKMPVIKTFSFASLASGD